MYAKRNALAKNIRTALMFCGASVILLSPGISSAGTFTGGATFPEQIVQEGTSLMSYAKEVTTALSSVQNEINTLNSYETDLQNLMSLPARELSKITTPIQQMEYNYQEAMNLENEYKSMYGSLSNIKSTVEQQNLDILNSSLSPRDYLNTVETAQTQTEKESREQIQQAAHSMQNVDKLAPIIQSQENADSGIDSNIGGQMAVSKELNTIEQQNQILLQDISSSEAAAASSKSLHQHEDNVANEQGQALVVANEKAVTNAEAFKANNAAAAQGVKSALDKYEQCMSTSTGTYLTCKY